MSVVVRERRRIDGQQGAIVYDTRFLPIVFLQWRGHIDLELLDAFGRWMDELLVQVDAEGLCIAMLVDPTRSEPPGPELRRVLIELRGRHLRRSRGRVVTDVIVSNRPKLRGLTRTLTWLNPKAPAVPVASVEQGLRHCRDALQRAGISAPSVFAEELDQPT